MKFFLKTVVTLLGSMAAVYAQKHAVLLGQWIIIYSWVFVCSWVFGMAQGMIATVVSLTLAGIFIIPENQFGAEDVCMLMILTCLGFWISFSMEKYKEGRAKLHKTEEIAKASGFLNSLLDNLPLMVFVKNADDLKFRNFNHAGLVLLGLKSEDLIGKNDYDFFPAEMAKAFQDKDREVLKSGVIHDIPMEEIDTPFGKKLLHTKKIPIMDGKGKSLYLLGVSEDITEKVALEKKRAVELQNDAIKFERQQIQERENFVAQAISSLSETIDYKATAHRLMRSVVPIMGDWAILSLWNEEGILLRVAGLHRDESRKPFIDEFIRDFPPNENAIEVQKAMKGEATLEKSITDEEFISAGISARKLELYHILGTFSSIIAPVRGREGILGILSISRDKDRMPFDELDFSIVQEIGRRAGTILDNNRLFLSTQRAVRARDEFLSIASHELKTPITALKLQLQMMIRGNKTKEIERPIINAIRQIDRLTMLVNDLLDVGRLESGKMNYHLTSTQLGSLVSEVAEAMHPQFEAAGTELKLELTHDPSVFVDSYRMEQVMVNLLNNAMKYGLGRPVHVLLEQKEKHAIFTVKDHGVGIPEGHISKIFDKFERGGKISSIAGLGLGLYITHEIVKAFNGTIVVKSKEGEGTEVSVHLPLS